MKTVVLSLLFTSLIFSQEAAWYWQNPLPQGNQLYKIQFLDSLTGYAAGDAGAIIKTTNGGNTWINQLTRVKDNFYSLYMIDESTGYACGGLDGSVLFKTIHGGNSWINITGNLPEKLSRLKNLQFINENVGFFVADNDESTYQRNLFRTTNGGNEWIRAVIPFNYINDAHFVNENIGWAAGDSGKIFKTINGGVNWIEQSANSFFRAKAIFFINENVGWAGLDNTIYPLGKMLKTTDGGTTWVEHPSPYLGYNEIYFENENYGWAIGSHGNLKTTNGGTDWILTSSPIGSSIDVKGSKLWISGLETNLHKSIDSGKTFTNLFSSVTHWDLNSIYFADENTGYAVGDYGTILKTTNAGSNWVKQTDGLTGTYFDFYSVFSTHPDTAWAVGEVGLYHKTTNGGQTWEWLAKPANTENNLTSIYFVNGTTGWIGGGGGVIFKTTDAGLNWTHQSSSQLDDVIKLYFVDEEYGWAVTSANKILKTVNGGESWTIHSAIADGFLFSLSFPTRTTGFIAGKDIYKTTDGGFNWTTVLDASEQFTSVFFLNENYGWAAGMKGQMYYTTDGGSNWDIQHTITNLNIHSIYYTDINNGWLVGPSGMIKKTNNGGITFMNDANNVNADNYLLSQNYPNPFNPSTRIKYNVPVTSQVKIDVYDVLGNLIKTVINENKPAGNYEVELNLSEYGSGVYLYRIQAGDFVHTKKMMLIK